MKIKKNRTREMKVIMSMILIMLVITIILGTVMALVKPRTNAAETSTSEVEEVVSDTEVIPDKYNTGAKGEFEVIPEETWYDETSGTQLKWRDTYYSMNVVIGDATDITIENKQIDYKIQIINATNLTTTKTYTFKNCKFNSIQAGKTDENVKLIFENCSFANFYGSNAKFYNCYFGGTVSDGMNPFQNVEVYNCFFSDLAKSSTTTSDTLAHSDGVQTYGGTDIDVQNVKFYNCRFEIPNFLYTYREGYVNAALMIQPEYADLHDVVFDKCIVNGGGYTIYINPKAGCNVYNLTLNNIKVGCTHWYGTLYPSPTLSTDDYEANNIVYNVSDTEDLYVGSVWEEEDGVHISVTNDTAVEKTLKVELSDGTIKEFDIDACLPGSTWWQGSAVQEAYDKYNYEDMPFDIELVVEEDTEWVKCYDGETLIRTQRLSSVEEPTTVAVTGVTLNKTSVSIEEGESIELTATVSPDNATNKNVSWLSSNTGVATVDSTGKVIAIAEGEATITVTTEDGSKTENCIVNVIKKEEQPTTVAVTGVTLNKTSVSIEEGESIELTATVSPDNATNKNVSWLSSNTGVATVDSTGKVTAIAEGEATITVTTKDGNKTQTCKIIVSKKENTNNEENNNTEQTEDKNTIQNNLAGTASGTLPQTGYSNFIIYALIGVLIIGGISYLKLKKLKNVK